MERTSIAAARLPVWEHEPMHVMAFDIGGTNVRAVIADASGTVAGRTAMPTERFLRGDPLALMAGIVRDEARALDARLAAVVVGVPGILDAGRRSVVATPLVPTLQIEGFADRLEERCGVPVLLDHDATLQTRGEALKGAAAGFERVLGVYFGTGVGAAFLDGGRLFGGPWRMQLGHVPLRGEGRIGTGGATDCVEAYASGLVLSGIAGRHGVPIADVFTAGGAGLAAERETFLRDQALTLAMTMTLLDPEVVVVGGGITEMAGYSFEDLADLTRRRLSPVLGTSERPIRRASLGAHGSLWGAVALARSQLSGG